MDKSLYIGVMTGTSMDGIDAVLVEITDSRIQTCAHYSQEITPELKEQLLSLCASGVDEIQRSGEADVQLGLEISQTVNGLLNQEQLEHSHINAIGSHGQTIRHSIDAIYPFSLQIGNPSIIAEKTGITTVGDFRMADIACNGQGAPLAPAFHEAAFSSSKESRLIINLGGIANITRLEPRQETTGFDTGPANTLMDQWISKCQHKAYDEDGQWAAQGKLIPPLLESMLNDPYFNRPAPKSTGREHFNMSWLNQHLNLLGPHEDQDVQRTLLELSAISIANETKKNCGKAKKVFLCGGGIYNSMLIKRLNDHLPDFTLENTDQLGINAQHVEAAAFAWFAYRTLNGLSSNLPSVTGARKNKILGGIYPAS